MALPASGAINLNEIHVEAGGTTGASCTINDSDIRGLVSAASGSAMDFADWYGASGGWSITLTQGNFQGKFCFKGCTYRDAFGYALYETYTTSSNLTYMKAMPGDQFTTDLIGANAVTHGSLSDTTFDTISNSVITGLYWDSGGIGGARLYFAFKGHHANSGWTTLTIGSTTFNRADGTHTQPYQGSPSAEDIFPYTSYSWSVTTNPFSTTDGTTHTVTIA
jgi:hypothetical protein